MKIITASGLRCWRCSSDASSSTFCGKTLELRELNDQQKRWSYVECSEKPPQNIENIENLIPKCKILLQHGEKFTDFLSTSIILIIVFN